MIQLSTAFLPSNPSETPFSPTADFHNLHQPVRQVFRPLEGHVTSETCVGLMSYVQVLVFGSNIVLYAIISCSRSRLAGVSLHIFNEAIDGPCK